MTPGTLIRPSIAEIRRVLARVFITAAAAIDHILAWSAFRLIHQTRALISHYRRRGDPALAENLMGVTGSVPSGTPAP